MPSYKCLSYSKKYIEKNVLFLEFLVNALVSGFDVTNCIDEVIKGSVLVFFLFFFEVLELFGGQIVRVVLFLELNE